MERRRGTSIAIIAALIVAVVSLGVSFAAFSQTLTINGSATVTASSWDIYFTNDSSNKTKPDASTGVSLTGAESNTAGNAETVSNATGTLKPADFTWGATFKTPGDKIVYDFYVYNAGDYDAEVLSINTPTPTCKKSSETETTVCSHIHYGVYTDENGATPVATGQELASKATAHYYVIAYLDNTGWATNGSDLPDADVSVNWTTISVTYQQK